jgi:hypothetical protein
MRAAVGGRTSSTKMKMAFSGDSLMRLRITYTNWPTVRSAGTRYFFLSMVAMSDFSTFSQMTWLLLAAASGEEAGCCIRQTYGNAVVVLLANALGLGLALLERVLVLELGAHVYDGDDVAVGVVVQVSARKQSLVCSVVWRVRYVGWRAGGERGLKRAGRARQQANHQLTVMER